LCASLVMFTVADQILFGNNLTKHLENIIKLSPDVDKDNITVLASVIRYGTENLAGKNRGDMNASVSLKEILSWYDVLVNELQKIQDEASKTKNMKLFSFCEHVSTKFVDELNLFRDECETREGYHHTVSNHKSEMFRFIKEKADAIKGGDLARAGDIHAAQKQYVEKHSITLKQLNDARNQLNWRSNNISNYNRR